MFPEYRDLISQLKQSDKRFASLCSAGLSQWKDKKPLIEATLKIFEDKMQIELPLLNK